MINARLILRASLYNKWEDSFSGALENLMMTNKKLCHQSTMQVGQRSISYKVEMVPSQETIWN